MNCIVLDGVKGNRLLPLSREYNQKHFMDIKTTLSRFQ